MEFEALKIKLSDLPKDIPVSVSTPLTDEQLREIIEDLRSQILYNSRHEEEATALPDLSVTVLEKHPSSVILRASI